MVRPMADPDKQFKAGLLELIPFLRAFARSLCGNPDMADDLPLIELDPGYGRALIENLLGLFRQVATDANPVHLRTRAGAEGVEIDVSTAAPGYRSIASLPPGSALSLDCAQRVAAMHGGSSSHSIDPAGGIRVRVMLP